jgi:hypothetical protein
MEDLFAAAREDAPSDVARDEVWGRVAAATAVPTAAVAAKAAVPAGGKLIAVGALLGAAGTAVALAFLAPAFEGPNALPTTARRMPATVANGPAAGAHLAEIAPRGRVAAPDVAPTIVAPPTTLPHPTATLDTASALAEEARLVTDARSALVRGEPERALASVRSTYSLAARALEPEELALEVRALRALGRTDEALATELTLRRRFPSHSLSR